MIFRGKFIALNASMRKEEMFKTQLPKFIF